MSKRYTNINKIPKQLGGSDNFTGTVMIQVLTATKNSTTMVGRVTFKKNSRTVWHKHSGEQVLYFLEGKGRVEIEDMLIDANPNDIVRIPPNTRHWHGAHPKEKNQMRHLAITNGNVTWLEPVPDETYQAE